VFGAPPAASGDPLRLRRPPAEPGIYSSCDGCWARLGSVLRSATPAGSVLSAADDTYIQMIIWAILGNIKIST
jgi:hypothetical protein